MTPSDLKCSLSDFRCLLLELKNATLNAMGQTEIASSSAVDPPVLPSRFENQTFGVTTTVTNASGGSLTVGSMDFNITAGVFLILLIAIVTALFLCCCRTYVLCKKRRHRQLGWERRVGCLVVIVNDAKPVEFK